MSGQIRIQKIIVSVLGLIALAGCAGENPIAATEAANAELESMSDMTMTAPQDTVAPGSTLQFKVWGGSAPYSFSVNGPGTITSNGLYTAPASSLEDQSVTVLATDEFGSQAAMEITVISGDGIISAALSPLKPNRNQKVTVTARGGKAPYTYTLISGTGKLEGNVYTTATVSETASIKVADSLGANILVPISTGGATSALLSLKVEQQKQNGAPCSSSRSAIGTVPDAVDGRYNSAVRRNVCVTAGIPSVNDQVIADIQMGTSCPSGYNSVGAVPHCTYKSPTEIRCTNVRVCVKTAPATVDRFVTGFYVASEFPTSAKAPSCAEGYKRLSWNGKSGTSACSGNSCYGLHSFCVAKN